MKSQITSHFGQQAIKPSMTPGPYRLAAAFLAAASLLAIRAPHAADTPDLTTLSLEDLAKLEVTSASRKSQTLADTPAAVFVITADDIARSVATTVPDLLRIVPGLEVAQIGTSRWAVTARGFNGRFANKLLVLVDGRTLYSPLFSGVVWEDQDIPLEDIERIEVIRGPGAAMWGANAVNGVINIITQSASRTHGGLATAVAGTQKNTLGTLQYGGAAGDSGSYRVYGRARNWDTSHDTTGIQDNDQWAAQRLGFRVDLQPTAQDHLLSTGEYFSSSSGDLWFLPALQAPYATPAVIAENNEGFNLLGRWERTRADGAESSAQLSLERGKLNVGNAFGETRDTLNFGAQHRLRLASVHDLIIGVEYLGSRDEISSSGFLSFSPTSRTYQRESAFGQDEITLIPGSLRASIGSRFEYNSISGYDPQPNARLLWNPTPGQTVWGAVSRAVRTLSRAESTGVFDLNVIPPGTAANPSALPDLIEIHPPDQRVSEKLDACEIGYRTQLGGRASVDLTAFYNRYHDLITSGANSTTTMIPGAVPYLLTQLPTSNSADGRARGAEVAVDWRLFRFWRMQLSYTYLYLNLAEIAAPDPSTPRSEFAVVSQAELTRRLQFDLRYRTVGQVAYGGVPAYNTLDARLGWRVNGELDLALIGTNLLHAHHVEAVTDFLAAATREVDRSVFIKATFRF